MRLVAAGIEAMCALFGIEPVCERCRTRHAVGRMCNLRWRPCGCPLPHIGMTPCRGCQHPGYAHRTRTAGFDEPVCDIIVNVRLDGTVVQ